MADTFPKNMIDDNGLKKVWDMVMDRLGLKVDKEAGKGLSTNDYTTAEKNKLAGIESGAEVNTVTSVAGKTGAVTLDKSDVGLANVGNFKAVSTSANQGLTNTEKSNARANIDTPSNGDIQSSKTVSGNPVTVNDAAPINAEDITVDITPIQDLHGYDRPWAGGAGKNKLEVTLSSGIYSNVQWAVDSQGHINISGTVPAGGVTLNTAIADVDTTVLAGYKFIIETSGSGNVYPRIMNNNLTSNLQDLSNGTIIEDNGSNCKLALRLENKGSYSKNISLMIIPPTETDSTFAPYSNICPIEGRTGAELDRVGKNWCIDSFEQGAILSTQGYTYSETKSPNSTRIRTSNLIKLDHTKTYTISCDFSKYEIVCMPYDEDGLSYFGSGSIGIWQSSEFQISGLYQCAIAIRLISQENLYPSDYSDAKPQIELGSTTATTYEPYQGQQYTQSFGQTVHGGKWHVTAGGTDNDRVYVIARSNNTDGETQLSNNIVRLRIPKVFIGNIKAGNAICSHLRYEENWNGGYQHFYCNSEGIYIYVPGSTTQEAKDYLEAQYNAGTPIEICATKTTPTTISTPKQNVPMLQGINTVYADCGDVSLKYQPDNVVGELKGEIEDSIIYEDYKWTTESSRTYSAGTPGTYGCSSWRDVKKEGYDVIGVTFVENRRFGDCILTLYYIPSTSHVEVIIFRATSSAVTIADEDITYRVAYKKH